MIIGEDMCRGVLAASTGTGRFIRARCKRAADRAAHTCKSGIAGAILSGWIEIPDVEKQATKVANARLPFPSDARNSRKKICWGRNLFRCVFTVWIASTLTVHFFMNENVDLISAAF